jgi:hypothetical protein
MGRQRYRLAGSGTDWPPVGRHQRDGVRAPADLLPSNAWERAGS